MHKSLLSLFVLACLLTIDTASAQKRKFNERRIKAELKFEGLWYADSEGNKITELLEVGEEVQLVIQANKGGDGKFADINMDEETCTLQLISDDYEKINGLTKKVVLNGDSYDPKHPDRKLNNLTFIKFVIIEETEECLDEYRKADKEREKRAWCEKRSWPHRSYNVSKLRRCPWSKRV